MERRDATRRRQLLQLDQPISFIRAKNKAADEARKQEESKNVLQGLLGDYSDSEEDNEEQVSNSQLEEPNEANPQTVSVLAKDSPKPSPPPLPSIPSAHSYPDPEKSSVIIDQSEDSIEEALKSFMSEINALPVTSINSDLLVPIDEFKDNEKESTSTQISNLDFDWEKYWHNENKCHYYYNKKTGETRWEHEIQHISSDGSLALSTSKEMNNLNLYSKEPNNTDIEMDSQTTTLKDNSTQNISLRVPPSDSPLHGRSHDAYSRLSNLAPIVTHLKLERHQIEFATRMHDWQIGALNSQYFEKVILEGLERLLQGVEEQVSPIGWVCKWKPETQTYNWIHLQTNQVSSTYPSQIVINSSSAYVASQSSNTHYLPALSVDVNKKSEYSEDVSHQGVQLATEKKRKKEKEPLISGFKNKKMATLVEKWKAAEDFLSNTDWDEVRKHQHGIGSSDPESWIKEQIESGEAANNPNLEPIKGDWRQRVRNKKI
ncbi:14921_t:CDS:2 [Funneliformis geosporum]|uniref:16271_t:CDS:1 n=1 Tax=Funneliformis geosporum TaxID=1117311 RepID=A0A9W4X1Z3_9GLOM|nr:14921_t:CDS:2 [Funneliformis geosporum]CAI2180551.1 16271_t:CDS:2 [Funneliformis geosporum]